MLKNEIYVTINHLDEFTAVMTIKPNDILTLKKDPGNIYDDEAIIAYNKNNCKCGYVANSVCTVARGTYSAGRVYDKIEDEQKCIVRFVKEDEFLIAEIIDDTQEKEEDRKDGING